MAEEVKHTPGPWEVRFAGNGYPYSIEAPNGNKGPGGITSVTHWGAISLPSSQEGLANARLMAASPELLEACIALIEAVDTAPPVDLMNHIVLASDLCRSAAAKATGSPQ